MNGAIYIPQDESDDIPRGSAIVGRDGMDRSPNSALGVSLATPLTRHEGFADIAQRAIQRGRGSRQVARNKLGPLRLIGYWNASQDTLQLRPGRDHVLATWIGRRISRSELEPKDSLSNRRQEARMDARRLDIQGRRPEAMQLRSRHNIHHW